MSLNNQHIDAKDNKDLLLRRFKEILKSKFPYLLPFAKKGSDRTLERRKMRPLLLAVSGGMDSMVLGHLLYEAGLPAIWVHCNFKLRGEESTRDEDFVRQQADFLQVPLIVQSFDAKQKAKEWKMSIEETARKLRYDFFKSLLQQDFRSLNGSHKLESYRLNSAGIEQLPGLQAPEFLMTAHHCGDQIETLLLNFFRGTGIAGLGAMRFKNDYILRPLLEVKRADLLRYARAMQIPWVEDSSNQSTDYTRNFLRHEILPALKKQYPYIEDTLLDNTRRFQQGGVLYQKGLDAYKKRLYLWKNDQLHLSVLLLQKSRLATTLLWEALKDFDFSAGQISEVEKLLEAGSGAYMDNPEKTYRILRNRAHLVLTPLSPEKALTVLIASTDHSVEFGEGLLELQSIEPVSGSVKIIQDPAVAQLDSRDIQFPLVLRKWKEGDYFYPLGMRKKKKVARFLTDNKLGIHEKSRIWVLESAGRIIWVVGQRPDDRFKISAGSEKVLKIRFTEKK
ncbi:tRNA(Ile)-lysidine synthase [Arachidicoccus rhizosphaerae]|uniref:tRNA(Ile)-lysidine synthase n=1 Tax=Arachidicoccus rhizosphaerae TaxID=551991 RepID=A0A1H3WB26_9BACT|nr:tRNA lysidine(34) synthetase TilS [Arachidicoccus rhizosphaerae]SDZ84329.1 tRNA(Ile)-lysidine synthase [Arachidicoccus rhizosphaerae]